MEPEFNLGDQHVRRAPPASKCPPVAECGPDAGLSPNKERNECKKKIEKKLPGEIGDK